MKTIATFLVLGAATFAPSTKIDPMVLVGTETNNLRLEKQSKEIAEVLIDAQSLRDLESVIINMPQTGNITPASVLALIESHRNTNKDHYAKNLNDKDNTITKALKERQQIILDANKAIKKSEYLQDEVDRLRKKLSDRK